jgi:hypothetical protein
MGFRGPGLVRKHIQDMNKEKTTNITTHTYNGCTLDVLSTTMLCSQKRLQITAPNITS